jgi:EAL domain-containing protein (putative c-di-GMP-specific phosphodiesterase class I)
MRQMTARELDPDNRLIADLAGAVKRHEITAYYQPQIDVITGEIVAVESLSRWLHPELGMQSPLVFIPIAEEFGMIDSIGEFMITEACRCAADLASRGLTIEVSVNVSALQLARSSFFEFLEKEVADCDLARDSITLEITESRFIANRPQVAQRLAKLRDQGVSVSIDDFGVGHSSVEQVLALPANELKIDRTIVQDAMSSGALMQTIVLLAKDRGLRTVAEGVETEAQLDRVRDLGCDRAQGYLIGKPMPKADLDALIGALSA